MSDVRHVHRPIRLPTDRRAEIRRTNSYIQHAIKDAENTVRPCPEVREFLQMSPLGDVMREYAFSDPASAAGHTMAEHIAIGARIADWRALNKRIEFLSMVAAKITFLSVLRNEGIALTLQPGDKFTSEPKELDPDIRAWIVDNRAAIVAELKSASPV
jgi:hypothetical protein